MDIIDDVLNGSSAPTTEHNSFYFFLKYISKDQLMLPFCIYPNGNPQHTVFSSYDCDIGFERCVDIGSMYVDCALGYFMFSPY